MAQQQPVLQRRRLSASRPVVSSLPRAVPPPGNGRKALWGTATLTPLPAGPHYQSVGQGGYACVISPAAPCDPSGQIAVPGGTAVVGKVFMDPENPREPTAAREAQDELNEARHIEALDPHHDFTPQIYGGCAIPNSVVPQLEGCPRDRLRVKPGGEPRVELVMESGGKDWSRVRWPNPATFLGAIKTVLKGLGVFVAHSVVHNDLKQKNLLYNAETGRTRIIDFGLTTSFAAAFDAANLATDYEYWPPEQAILGWLRDQTAQESVVKILYRGENSRGSALHFLKWSGSLQTHLVDLGLARRLAAVGGTVSRAAPRDTVGIWTAQMREFVDKLRAAVPNPSDVSALRAVYTQLLPKHDIYGLGVSLQWIIAQEHVSYDHDTTAEDIRALALGMSEPSPLHRLSITDALAMVDRLQHKRQQQPPATLQPQQAPSNQAPPRSPVRVAMDVGWEDYARRPRRRL